MATNPAPLTKFLPTTRYLLGGRRHVLVVWPDQGPVSQNWGDKLNPWLVARLSGRPVMQPAHVSGRVRRDQYAVIGSYLGDIKPGIKVWGGGCTRFSDRPRVRLADVCAVRGPLSVGKLSHLGDVSALPLGDPALLMPLLYNGPARKTHRLGLISHFRENHLPLFDDPQSDPAIKRINITGGIEAVVDAVLGCEAIVTSSLHGAILAHAYGIPATVVSASNLPLGDGFKFLDYLHSVGLADPGVIPCDNRSQLLAAADLARRPARLPDMRRLLDACPFLDPAIATPLRARIPNAYRWLDPASQPALQGN